MRILTNFETKSHEFSNSRYVWNMDSDDSDDAGRSAAPVISHRQLSCIHGYNQRCVKFVSSSQTTSDKRLCRVDTSASARLVSLRYSSKLADALSGSICRSAISIVLRIFYSSRATFLT